MKMSNALTGLFHYRTQRTCSAERSHKRAKRAAAATCMVLATAAHAEVMTIVGEANGDLAFLSASSDFNGAISSFSFRGAEYLDTHDYGRLLQSAAFYDGFTECYGPTEAGSRAGFPSQLLSWSN